jgi:hypothetical protein
MKQKQNLDIIYFEHLRTDLWVNRDIVISAEICPAISDAQLNSEICPKNN